MKKYLALISVAIILGGSTPKEIVHAADFETLYVYNWQDYIDDGLDSNGNRIYEDVNGNQVAVNSLIEDFEADYKEKTGKTVKVVYDTFETNENMLNTIKTGKGKYDLVCPSDYIIQRMIKDDMLEKFDMENGKLKNIPNYETYASPLIKDLFIAENWYEYAVGYMWGTLGLVYNPDHVEPTDVESWGALWNVSYKNKVTIKDSVRDSYLMGVLYAYRGELLSDYQLMQDNLFALKYEYEAGNIDEDEYENDYMNILKSRRELLNDIANRTDEVSIKKAEDALKAVKGNVYGFEVDSGKIDIINGKIDINYAWSGDAVFALDEAEAAGTILNYSVPKEGGNIWFDGFVMPKGANKPLAQAFIDYLSLPANAVRNMNKIGYTSAIAGNEVLEMVNEWYAYDDTAEGASSEDITYDVDLSYFFNGTIDNGESAIITVDTLNRQFSAQYPDIETVYNSAIMRDFGDKNPEVLAMWQRVKSNPISIGTIIFLVAILLIIILFVIYRFTQKRARYARMRRKRA